jgi:glycosyltransferase involved in cell wall biosynthesis
MRLVLDGHAVQAFKTNVDDQQPRLVALRAAGCLVTDLAPRIPLYRRIANRLLPYHRQLTPRKSSQHILRQGLLKLRPQLTVISQGSNYDGFIFADVCRQLGLPYVLLAQKVVDTFFPPQLERALVQQVYRAAQHCFFVSRHNMAVTQLQLGMPLPQAEVVWNPYNVSFEGEMPWPTTPNGSVRLACVARLHVKDKGQDLLLQVLAQPKWQQRPVQLALYGAGPDEPAIRGMVEYLGLQDKVRFAGHVADITEVWQTHHALLLPSRQEGLPLALVEAMLAGRPTVATDIGGIGELLIDNETGFLAAAPTTQALDEALERAWAVRHHWPALGAAAAQRARTDVPMVPAEQFARKLLAIARLRQPR